MVSRITGRERLAFILKALPPSVREEIRKAIAAEAENTAAMMRSLAPFHSGKLRDSIVVTEGNRPLPPGAPKPTRGSIHDSGLAAIITVGNKEVYYARWVEFGTAPHTNAGEFKGSLNPGSPAEPFFLPAIRSTRRKAQTHINKAAREGIKKVVHG